MLPRKIWIQFCVCEVFRVAINALRIGRKNIWLENSNVTGGRQHRVQGKAVLASIQEACTSEQIKSVTEYSGKKRPKSLFPPD